MKSPSHFKLIAAFGLTLLAGTSHALAAADYGFQIDSFFVFKNIDPNALNDPTTLAGVTPLFVDGFDNGALPGTAGDALTFSNGTPASYTVSGTVGPELGSKLTLSSSGMVDNGYGTLRTNVNLNTDISTDATKGLKSADDNFVVVGVWDLTNPGNSNGSYGVRFNDSLAGATGNDVISLAVQGRADGQAVVSMLHFNNVTGTSDLLDRQVLDTSHQQIALGLGYLDTDGNGTKEVGAGYFYLDGGLPTSFHAMSATTSIFHGEDWTRAAFFAADSLPAPVPEPADYLLMLAGLGLVGFIARGRRHA